jgi:hypothetical protein
LLSNLPILSVPDERYSRNASCTRLSAASDQVYQLLAHARWFSPDTPASSTIKTGRHDIAEILMKVALSTQKNQSTNHDNHCSPLFEMVSLFCHIGTLGAVLLVESETITTTKFYK